MKNFLIISSLMVIVTLGLASHTAQANPKAHLNSIFKNPDMAKRFRLLSEQLSRRDSLANEPNFTLAKNVVKVLQNRGGGGELVEFRCPEGKAIHRVYTYADRYVHGYNFDCRSVEPDGSPEWGNTQGLIGYSNAEFSYHHCRGDDWITGFHGRSGSWLDKSGVLCSSIAQAQQGSYYRRDAVGEDGGSEFTSYCGIGFLATGANIRVNDSYIASIQPICTRLDDLNSTTDDMAPDFQRRTSISININNQRYYWHYNNNNQALSARKGTLWQANRFYVESANDYKIRIKNEAGERLRFPAGNDNTALLTLLPLSNKHFGFRCSNGSYLQAIAIQGNASLSCDATWLNPSSTYFKINPSDFNQTLTNNVSRTNIQLDAKREILYSIDVPAEQTKLKVLTLGGTGDADLYLRHGTEPNINDFDCRSAGVTATETCEIANPKPGTYHILVRAWSNFDNVNLIARFSRQLEQDTVLPVASATTLEQKLFTFVTPDNTANVEFKIENSGSHAELFVKAGSVPTPNQADCISQRAPRGENGVSCRFSSPNTDQTYYLLVRTHRPYMGTLRVVADIDTDGDGQYDPFDEDDDNDGVRDLADAFPLDPSESLDTDGDGIGNNADTDDDGDGVSDSEDEFPIDENNQYADSDNDGILDNLDNCPGFANTDQRDNDNDGVGDMCPVLEHAFELSNWLSLIANDQELVSPLPQAFHWFTESLDENWLETTSCDQRVEQILRKFIVNGTYPIGYYLRFVVLACGVEPHLGVLAFEEKDFSPLPLSSLVAQYGIGSYGELCTDFDTEAPHCDSQAPHPHGLERYSLTRDVNYYHPDQAHPFIPGSIATTAANPVNICIREASIDDAPNQCLVFNTSDTDVWQTFTSSLDLGNASKENYELVKLEVYPVDTSLNVDMSKLGSLLGRLCPPSANFLNEQDSDGLTLGNLFSDEHIKYLLNYNHWDEYPYCPLAQMRMQLIKDDSFVVNATRENLKLDWKKRVNGFFWALAHSDPDDDAVCLDPNTGTVQPGVTVNQTGICDYVEQKADLDIFDDSMWQPDATHTAQCATDLNGSSNESCFIESNGIVQYNPQSLLPLNAEFYDALTANTQRDRLNASLFWVKEKACHSSFVDASDPDAIFLPPKCINPGLYRVTQKLCDGVTNSCHSDDSEYEFKPILSDRSSTKYPVKLTGSYKSPFPGYYFTTKQFTDHFINLGPLARLKDNSKDSYMLNVCFPQLSDEFASASLEQILSETLQTTSETALTQNQLFSKYVSYRCLENNEVLDQLAPNASHTFFDGLLGAGDNLLQMILMAPFFEAFPAVAASLAESELGFNAIKSMIGSAVDYGYLSEEAAATYLTEQGLSEVGRNSVKSLANSMMMLYFLKDNVTTLLQTCTDSACVGNKTALLGTMVQGALATDSSKARPNTEGKSLDPFQRSRTYAVSDELTPSLSEKIPLLQQRQSLGYGTNDIEKLVNHQNDVAMANAASINAQHTGKSFAYLAWRQEEALGSEYRLTKDEIDRIADAVDEVEAEHLECRNALPRTTSTSTLPANRRLTKQNCASTVSHKAIKRAKADLRKAIDESGEASRFGDFIEISGTNELGNDTLDFGEIYRATQNLEASQADRAYKRTLGRLGSAANRMSLSLIQSATKLHQSLHGDGPDWTYGDLETGFTEAQLSVYDNRVQQSLGPVGSHFSFTNGIRHASNNQLILNYRTAMRENLPSGLYELYRIRENEIVNTDVANRAADQSEASTRLRESAGQRVVAMYEEQNLNALRDRVAGLSPSKRTTVLNAAAYSIALEASRFLHSSGRIRNNNIALAVGIWFDANNNSITVTRPHLNMDQNLARIQSGLKLEAKTGNLTHKPPYYDFSGLALDTGRIAGDDKILGHRDQLYAHIQQRFSNLPENANSQRQDGFHYLSDQGMANGTVEQQAVEALRARSGLSNSRLISLQSSFPEQIQQAHAEFLREWIFRNDFSGVSSIFDGVPMTHAEMLVMIEAANRGIFIENSGNYDPSVQVDMDNLHIATMKLQSKTYSAGEDLVLPTPEAFVTCRHCSGLATFNQVRKSHVATIATSTFED